MPTPQTVFVTGASGFIAKHILVRLLNAGIVVVGSVRNLDRQLEVIAAITPHLTNTENLNDRLKFVALDLNADTGWNDAMQGADALLHTASPFPMSQPKNEQDLIRPAVDGTRRALSAAQTAGINRVVMTSSIVAIMGREIAPGKALTESDWTDIAHPSVTAYGKSKTQAERAAWDFVANDAPDMALTVINPALVFGAPLDPHYGTSLKIIERILRAQDPMLPKVSFPIVDVQDVAEMHLRALMYPGTDARRFICADTSLWFTEIAEILKADHPDRKIVTRKAPNFLIRLLAKFDPALRSIVPTLGIEVKLANTRAKDIMDMKFTSSADAVRNAARYLIDNGHV